MHGRLQTHDADQRSSHILQPTSGPKLAPEVSDPAEAPVCPLKAHAQPLHDGQASLILTGSRLISAVRRALATLQADARELPLLRVTLV
jgi:hypothetical protein